MTHKKVNNALVLLRYVLTAFGFTEKPKQKDLKEKEQFSIDPVINGKLRVYLKTGIVATELVARFKESVEVAAISEGIDLHFGSITINVDHLNKRESTIIKVFGPLLSKDTTPKKPISLVDVVKILKQKELVVKNQTKNNGYWGLYFLNSDIAQMAYNEINKIFPSDGIVHMTGGKAVKVLETLVVTMPRGGKIKTMDTEKLSSISKSKSGVDDFVKQITSVAMEFAKKKSADPEVVSLKKLQKSHHMIDKKVSVVKIPLKLMGTSVVVADGFVTISIPVLVRYLKK